MERRHKYAAYVAWGQHRALPRGDGMARAFGDLARDRFIPGDPAACVEEIGRCASESGATTLVFRMYWPGMPHETAMEALRVLGDEVFPRLG